MDSGRREVSGKRVLYKSKVMRLHHTGYITGDIAETANTFKVLGYVQQPIFDDTIQKCFICFLKREENEPMIELVQPYDNNKSMQKMLAKGGGETIPSLL